MTQVLGFTRGGAHTEAQGMGAMDALRPGKERAIRPEEVVQEGMRAFIDSVAANLGASSALSSSRALRAQPP